ncbi:MAG TPA: S-adenosylmethionine:tRNA ribosyltransferase-isomerase [Vicinamibacterales bacterium]|nr:S-adenosylmethionine:tRNA ribosyltransferase-isomerase [Vicinamibacterales bacterium]
MTAAERPAASPGDAKLLVIDITGSLRHAARRTLVDFLRPGDLVVANDAATLPASLYGVHAPSGGAVEARLAGWQSRAWHDAGHFSAVVFGAGDYHTRTEDRALPPPLAPGDRLAFGPLSATVTDILGHPRLVSLWFEGSTDEIWEGLAHHGRPIQYAHIATPLLLWDVWTAVAGTPAAFEPPSAGFALNRRILADMRVHGIRFVTVTHAAGISSTGDAELDAWLPLDEPYEIPPATARAIAATRAEGGRIVAIGTTVVRALEHAAARDGVVRAGASVATQKITATTAVAVVDAILSGIHEPGTSHYELLRAFAADGTLIRANHELGAHGYRTHEFGDSVFIERSMPSLKIQPELSHH